MDLKVLHFDAPLIGGDFDEGYRLILGEFAFHQPCNRNHGLDLIEVMDWFCDEFGNDGNTYHLVKGSYFLQNPGSWKCLYQAGDNRIYGSRPRLLITTRSLCMIEKFCEKFSCTFSVDESSTLESQIRRCLNPFLFKLATQKVQRRIAASISETLRKNSFIVPWYRVHFNLDDQTILVKLNEHRNLSINMRLETP